MPYTAVKVKLALLCSATPHPLLFSNTKSLRETGYHHCMLLPSRLQNTSTQYQFAIGIFSLCRIKRDFHIAIENMAKTFISVGNSFLNWHMTLMGK